MLPEQSVHIIVCLSVYLHEHLYMTKWVFSVYECIWEDVYIFVCLGMSAGAYVYDYL